MSVVLVVVHVVIVFSGAHTFAGVNNWCMRTRVRIDLLGTFMDVVVAVWSTTRLDSAFPTL